MRTITLKAYQFSELSEDAKEKAVKNYIESNYDQEYFWGNDAVKSLEGFIEHMGGSLVNYNIDFLEPYRNNIRFSIDPVNKKELRGLIMSMGEYNKKTLKGLGDCKFTGYCMDEDAADGAREAFLKGETDIEEIILAGIASWEIAVRKDAEYQFSEEFAISELNEGDQEFTEEGDTI